MIIVTILPGIWIIIKSSHGYYFTLNCHTQTLIQITNVFFNDEINDIVQQYMQNLNQTKKPKRGDL